MMRISTIIHIVFLLLVLCSCSDNEEDNRITTHSEGDITKLSTSTPIDQSITNEIKQRVLEREEVTAVRGINTDNELLLAIEVTQLNQFREQDIEKELKKSLEKKYSDRKIDVSSDQKIFIELDKLEKQVQNNKLNKKDLNNKYKDIKKLLNDPA